MAHRCRGFTLLELMVVIVLIAVLLGMVGLVGGQSPARQARQHAQQFILLAQQLREQAMLQGQEHGLRLLDHGYQALRLDAQGWTTVSVFHRLPENLRLALEQEGHAVRLDDAQGPPQLLMLSSDEISPFRLIFKVAGQPFAQVLSDGIGEPLLDE
ncbi:type II secretion system minor pseudopilin GspH [Pseudomonas sp. T1.Ur]|nr:type II secretion system minor pseudopilin GspH [Pseudomonas sp. T1.Ur]